MTSKHAESETITSRRVHPVDRLVGQRVRMLRLNRGMSQTALANQLGLTFQQVQKYERGTNRISASKLVEIAKALDVDVAGLFQDAIEPGATAAAAAAGFDDAPPTQVDVSIVRLLSQIRNTSLKRRVLALLTAVVENGESSEARQ
jgi:transcriptional regulator with XRE-family HTH domain